MRVIKTIFLVGIISLMAAGDVKAADFSEPTRIRCTCYSMGTVTASGEPVREGYISGKREWMGKTAVLYDMDMNVIGFYEFKDTGSAKSLKNGTSIDVYRSSLDRCHEWIKQYGDYVYIQIVEGAEG